MIKKVNEEYVQVICEECGSIELECETIEEATDYEENYGYVITFNGETKIMYSCCEGDYRWCDGCNEYHYVYDTDFYTVGYHDYCEQYALDEGYIGRCTSCEEIMDMDYLYWHEGHGEYFCDDCYPYNSDEIISEWHQHKYDDVIFNKADKEEEPKFYFGIELEIDKKQSNYNYNITTAETIREEHFTSDEMYFEEDGSLWGGFEIITQPMSYNFILDNKERFADLFNYLDLRGYTGEDNKSAGLHMHISRENLTDNDIENIVYFIENNLYDIHKLSRRPGDINRYACSYCFDSIEQYKQAKEIDGDLAYSEVMRLYNKKNYSRYHMVNVTNDNTIEFRFFKSTLDIDNFIGSIQFINTLVNMAINGHLKDWHNVEDIVNYTDETELYNLVLYANDKED